MPSRYPHGDGNDAKGQENKEAHHEDTDEPEICQGGDPLPEDDEVDVCDDDNKDDDSGDDDGDDHEEDDEDDSRAPLRLMAQFLRAITEQRMTKALELADAILQHEPDNPMILEYKTTLTQYLENEATGGEETDEEKEDDDNEDEDDDDDDDDGVDDEGVTEEGERLNEHGDDDDESGSEVEATMDAATNEPSNHLNGGGGRGRLSPTAATAKEEAQLAELFQDLRAQVREREEASEAVWDDVKYTPSVTALEGLVVTGIRMEHSRSQSPVRGAPVFEVKFKVAEQKGHGPKGNDAMEVK